MISFTIVDNQLQVKAEDLLLADLLAIWENDPSKKKDVALRQLKYVFFMADKTNKNPLRDLSRRDKELRARREAFGVADYEFSEGENLLIQDGIQAYLDGNDTPERRMYEAYGDEVDLFREMLENPANKPEMVRSTTNSGTVQFSSNSSIISAILKDIEKILEARDKIVSRMNKGDDDTVQSKNRKGYVESNIESGAIGYDPAKAKKKKS